MFTKPEGAAEMNFAIGFASENIENGTCIYFYTHENNTVMENIKRVCTADNINNL